MEEEDIDIDGEIDDTQKLDEETDKIYVWEGVMNLFIFIYLFLTISFLYCYTDFLVFFFF